MNTYKTINTFKCKLSKIYAGQASEIYEKVAFSHVSDFPVCFGRQSYGMLFTPVLDCIDTKLQNQTVLYHAVLVLCSAMYTLVAK